eukprot:CCRYP_010858-RB/>CCRYP_010858-RB protein AED:0.04 eAED:0.04 QI:150/1/1/1/0.5/0.33/3/1421/485
MPPKPPTQAGKFKPLKRPAKPAAAAPAPPPVAPSADHTKSPGRGRDGRGREGRGREGRGREGRGREGRGRDGRGRGRDGRGGGRFVAPTGAAFFTGASTKQPDGAQDTLSKTNASASIAAGQDGAVVLPFTKPFSNDARGSISGVARTAAESMAAAARARLGEGEEIVVAELDMGEDYDEGKKKSVLERSSSRFDGMPSLFDDENTEQISSSALDGTYVYDSDSSAEERRRDRKKGSVRDSGSMPPNRLPFPLASYQSVPMYACQEDVEEKKDGIESIVSSTAVAQLNDPEVTSPFLDWSAPCTREDMKFAERNSWFLMKFPTRLPHLDHGSLVGSASSKALLQQHQVGGDGLVKSELNEDGLEVVGSNTEIGDASNVATVPLGLGEISGAIGSGGPLRYDDTLKDIAPGKYGKIVVYKSGRTELVVGGHAGGAEVRMLIHEGLQCGFRQEAVSIDPEEGTFVPLGDVAKSLIVTPDVERAFVFS